MSRDKIYFHAVSALGEIIRKCEYVVLSANIKPNGRYDDFFKFEKFDDGTYNMHVTKSVAEIFRMMGNFSKYCGKYSDFPYVISMYDFGKFYLKELKGTPMDISKIFEVFMQIGLEEYYRMHGNIEVGQTINLWGRDYLVSSLMDGEEIYLIDMMTSKMYEDRAINVDERGEVNRSEMIELLGGIRQFEESVIA